MWNYDIKYAEIIVWSTFIYKKKPYSICTSLSILFIFNKLSSLTIMYHQMVLKVHGNKARYLTS